MKRAKGISLLEMLLVIAIGAAVIMAAVRYFSLTTRNVHVTQAIQQIQTLTQASYEWLQTQKQDDFSTADGGIAISTQELINAGLIKNKETKDPWAGTVKIEPGSDPSRIRITMLNIPKRACKNLARRLDKVSKITMPPCNGATNNYSGEF